MTGLSEKAQEALRKMEREIRVRDASQDSYAVIKAIYDRKTPVAEIILKIKRIIQQVEAAE